MTEHEYWFWICSIIEIGPAVIDKLLAYFGDLEHIFMADASVLETLDLGRGYGAKARAALIHSRNEAEIAKSYAAMKARGASFVSIEEVEYPKVLKHIEGAPKGLFYRGQLPSEVAPAIAIVGGRQSSAYGRTMAECFGRSLGASGVSVISGLARGIDGFAHSGALKGGGYTLGVLGCGVDICYPRENFTLYMEIQRQGCLLSEFPLGTPPLSRNFPMRNRIISGLADGILVIEARKKSGSLITADFGLEQGKDIFVIPGRGDDPLCEGCNNLIKQGAHLVTNPEEILESYHIHVKETKKNNKALAKTEELVYDSISLTPKSFGDLLKDVPLTQGELANTLVSLELLGHIKQVGKGYYIRTT